jgi:signal transduction histidine kinase
LLSWKVGGRASITERVTDVFDQVREISHGIHPAILSERGLTPALKALARRSAVPVELDLRTGRRLPDQVEVAAYYAVSEALANSAKHAHASVVHVELNAPGATQDLRLPALSSSSDREQGRLAPRCGTRPPCGCQPEPS